jgi:hypothetical protein
MAQIIDKRTKTLDPVGYVVGRDSFMSGWGSSYYALAIADDEDWRVVVTNMIARPEMHDVRC